MKFELPVITKEMNINRLKESIRNYQEQEINKFVKSCYQKYTRSEHRIKTLKEELTFLPEEERLPFLRQMTEEIINKNFEHHGQIEITKVEEDLIHNVFSGHKSYCYCVTITYTPQFMKE